MTTTTTPARSVGDTCAALALILVPWLTVVVKFIVPGWMLLFYGFGLVLFVPLYVLVIVIAVQGFLGRRPAFAWSSRQRARVAAWAHPVAFLLATGFLEDGGDTGSWGSPFGQVTGVDLGTDVSFLLFAALTIVSGAALAWLVGEWILALVLRRRATVAA